MNKESVRNEIRRFVAREKASASVADAWRTPLVGFSAADDPLFQELKSAVSPTHELPGDLLSSAKSVVSFFVPFGKPIVNSNKEGRLASREWAMIYVLTNNLIYDLGQRLTRFLEEDGHESFVPPATHNFDKARLISDWSHRHVAVIAGLGKFGLNNMLITESGCCGRIGSLVTSLPFSADERPEQESCLHRHNGSCLACVKKCIGGALFPDNYDRKRCYEICRENEVFFEGLGKADVCGKCLVGLPCSLEDPVFGLLKRTGR